MGQQKTVEAVRTGRRHESAEAVEVVEAFEVVEAAADLTCRQRAEGMSQTRNVPSIEALISQRQSELIWIDVMRSLRVWTDGGVDRCA